MEYWLQKKSLGGWSVVIWYGDLDQAKLNYQRCVGKDGLSGYSWRLVEVKVVEQALLDEVTEVEPPELPQKSLKKAETIKYSNSFVVNPKPVSNGWGNTKSGWSNKLNPEQQADVNNAWSNFKSCNSVSAGKNSADPYAKENRLNETDGFYDKPEHGLTGSVWVIHHKDKIKKRVAATAVDEMLKLGYERGGPKTKFRE